MITAAAILALALWQASPRNMYHAVTVDLAEDGTVASCSKDRNGVLPGEDCEAIAARHAALLKVQAPQFRSLTFVVALDMTGRVPNVRKSAWGARQGRLVTEQLSSSGSAMPFSCETLIAEGWSEGEDGCIGFKTSVLPNRPPRSATRTQVVEAAVFAVKR